jgi:predicted protein tyrosine phosphatase
MKVLFVCTGNICRSPAAHAVLEHRLAEAYNTIYKPHVMPLIDREGHPATLLD